MSDDAPSSLTEAGEHWRALLVDDADCCELLARLKEEYDIQHATIERLCARILELEAVTTAYQRSLSCRSDQLNEMFGQRAKLEERITELEAAAAVTHGALAQPTLTPDEATTIVHDVAPNAPR